MYLFQSLHRNNNVQLPSKKVIRFNDYYYGTENSALGEELSGLCGREFLENRQSESDGKAGSS